MGNVRTKSDIYVNVRTKSDIYVFILFIANTKITLRKNHFQNVFVQKIVKLKLFFMTSLDLNLNTT